MEETAVPTRRRWLRQDKWEDARRPLGYLIAILYAALLLFSISWSRCFFTTCPDVKKLAIYQPGGAPVLLDRNGEAFADLAPAEREIVPLPALPSYVAQAFLAVEDQRFYEHGGVDWRRVGGAMLANLKAGGFAEGFSTITMQLARNVFPDRIPGEEQTTRRKLLEIRVAQEIERSYSKQEILELYLNNIYFGNRARGIEAASRQYFSHPAKELTLPEAALLAALPKAPSHYDPRRHPDEALERRNLVVDLMREQGRLPRFMAEDARRSRLEIAPAPRQEKVESGLAPYFVEQVRRELEERFGPNLYTQPLRIVTTLDSSAQRIAEEELRRQLKLVEDGDSGPFDGPYYTSEAEPPAGGTPYLQGAVVMMDARDGDVLAWVGGRDFSHSQFDRVVQARRQPGSAFKPFVYAAALRDGWALSQPLLDAPLRIKLSARDYWEPKNFTGEYDGRITMRDALVRSKNVATVRLADAVGLKEVSQLAHDAGIEETIADVPSMPLGTVAVSPLELTSAYTAFANLGKAVESRLLLRVEDENGKVLWWSQPKRREALDPGVAFLVTDVLAEALVRGTGNLVQRTGLKAPAAGKTGTTNEGADVWFVGYTPEIVASVWMGFDKPKPILEEATGGRLAAPAWGRMLARVYQKRKAPKTWTAPDNVVSRMVDPATGLVIEKGCAPRQGEARRELFLSDKEPAAYCPGREDPPRNGFPSQRLIAQREADEEEEKTAERRDQDRIAQASPAQPQRQEDRDQEARKAADAEAARRKAELEARKERLAKAEAAADRREKEIAAREKATREKKRDRKEEQRAAEAVEKEREARKAEEERQARAEKAKQQRDEERRRARAEEEEEQEKADREDRDREEATSEDSDLSGWWEMTNTIQSTNFESYRGLRLTYRVQLEQDGDRITGRGQKWEEDGRRLTASARSPITVRGTMDGRKVTLTFTERGAKRSTSGGFSWTLTADRTALRGTFWSTAAATSGSSLARRMP
ncbi:MAG: PBP1A family penicillin-binding protein [Thermoanaerobaculia bacterium]